MPETGSRGHRFKPFPAFPQACPRLWKRNSLSFLMRGHSLSFVMRGLDPRIHDERQQVWSLRPCLPSSLMDGRDIGVRKHAVLWTAMPGHDKLKAA